MILTLDGERIEPPGTGCGSLQELIDAVREAHLDDRIVVSVTIDGRPLTGSELSDRLTEPLDEVGQIDLESDEAAVLGAQVLREVADDLAIARDGLAEIAQYIQAGQSDAAMGGFCGFLDTWRNAQQAMGQCSGLLGRDFSPEVIDDRPVGEYVEELANSLREMRDAFVARDTILLTDLIEYEMPELCQTWRGLLTELADRVDPNANASEASPGG